MYGKEFHELQKNILELADVKERLQYLDKNGLNVKSVIRKIDHRLGVSKIRSPQLMSRQINVQRSFLSIFHNLYEFQSRS